ncbi:glycosyltransferase [Oscillatoria sp. CS-180]|uniref:glycosyltransferase n=1 Tax=Oscillatoria sp. CS-180 TaxID=3021720 RepID=UPI00232FF406|nr:glycosyltransferase [Oscillatoria sp. CS-180]MDB9527128.1 glycosyltransferase [Oscillatoria sp. CS-180]
MRIAFIVGHFPRLSETFILNQVTGLIDRGHQVDIFSEYEGDWQRVHPDVEQYDLRQYTYPLHPVPASYGQRFWQGARLALTRWPQAPGRIVRSLNPLAHGRYALGLWTLYSSVSLIDQDWPAYDIVHCQFGTQGHRGWFLQRLMAPATKLVVMFRGHDISSYVRQKGEDVYTDLFHAADACLTNCNFFRQRLIQLGCPAHKVAVHYSGLDIGKFDYQPRRLDPDGTIQLLTTGRLVEKKGIEYVIRAIARLARRYDKLKYTIVGDGPLRGHFEDLIRNLGLENFVQLVGWQDEQALIHQLSQAHVFIAPSVTAEDGNQDAPINVLKEAMAIGLPVVSTRHGGIPELVQDSVSGYLVPERDVAALSDRIEQLINSPERWPEMGQAGRTFVEQHFNLHMLNDRLVTRYEELLRTKDPPPRSLPLANFPA